MQPNYDALYRAIVTSNVDSTGHGKIRVQCPQISGLAEIRAAEPANPQMPVPATGTTVWLAFNGGDITKPIYFSNTGYINLSSDGTTVHAQALTSTALPDASQINLTAGVNGAVTGASDAPQLVLKDVAGSSATDLLISGSVIKTDNLGNPYSWQNPTYQTTWSGITSFLSLSPVDTLQYKKDGEDNVYFRGAFTCGSGAGAVVFTLPAGYHDTVQYVGFSVHEKQAGGTYQIGLGYVSPSGNFHIDLGNNFTRNNGDTYYVNAKMPLGNLS